MIYCDVQYLVFIDIRIKFAKSFYERIKIQPRTNLILIS